MFSSAASRIFIDLLPDQSAIALYNLQNCKETKKLLRLGLIFLIYFQIVHHPVCFHLWTNRAGEKIMSR